MAATKYTVNRRLSIGNRGEEFEANIESKLRVAGHFRLDRSS